MHYVLNYFDYERGWEGTNPGWYTVNIPNKSPDKHLKMCEWLYTRIDKVERHARWAYYDSQSRFRFRYERDYILFTLTWQ